MSQAVEDDVSTQDDVPTVAPLGPAAPTRQFDRELLAYKVRWEGGIVATLEWGMRAEDISDAGLRAKWAELSRLYDEMRPLLTALDKELRP